MLYFWLIWTQANFYPFQENYGIDWQGPVPDQEETRYTVEVTNMFCPIKENHLSASKKYQLWQFAHIQVICN